jgi:hypothetical protein
VPVRLTRLLLALAVRLERLLELPTQDKATILFLAPLLPPVEVEVSAANKEAETALPAVLVAVDIQTELEAQEILLLLRPVKEIMVETAAGQRKPLAVVAALAQQDKLRQVALSLEMEVMAQPRLFLAVL